MHEQHQLKQFLLLVFVLLGPCFALWTSTSELLARPAVGFVNSVLNYWFPTIVDALYLDGDKTLLTTQFGHSNGALVPASESPYRVGYEINTRLLSYSLPFYTALHFATLRKEQVNHYLWGLLVLYPLMALGLLAVCMKELMVGLGSRFLQQPEVWVPDPNIIGLLYQFSVLMVPALAPVMLWVWQSKDSPILSDAWQRATHSNQTTNRTTDDSSTQ